MRVLPGAWSGLICALLSMSCGKSGETRHAGVATAVGELEVTMALPEDAVVTMRGATAATIRIAGLPELVVEGRPNTLGRVTQVSVGKHGKVSVSRATHDTIWSCVADPVPDAVANRVQALCDSLRPPEHPNAGQVLCRDRAGNVNDARVAWLGERVAPIVACFAAEVAKAPTLDLGVFVLAAEFAGGKRVREQHAFSAPGHTIVDPACFDRATAAIEADAGYAPASGSGQFKCTVQLSRY